MKQAAATSIGLGMPNITLAMVPGHIGTKSKEELRRDVIGVTAAQVIQNLTVMPAAKGTSSEPGVRDIVVRGGFNAVNKYFVKHEYSDGLPVVPPTKEAIEEFLRFTERSPDEVLGVLLPDRRAATVWSVAVNGVMAGCRPEYMPILVATIEAMADPKYAVEHSGNTPGGDTLIILNGPIIKQLDFNYTQGALRDGFQPNTSIGRFFRLYLRNVAGFLLPKTDKATFGNTWRVVLAENDDVLKEIGWETTGEEMGFKAGDNTVTISRFTGGGSLSSVSGSTPEQLLPYIADALVKQHRWQLNLTVFFAGTLRPLLLLTPILAETIAHAGWSKDDVRRYLFEHARLPAWELLRYLQYFSGKPRFDFEKSVRSGKLPAVFFESDDPDRLVPIVFEPQHFMIAVTGDPLRTNAYAFSHNGPLGFPTTKKIMAAKAAAPDQGRL